MPGTKASRQNNAQSINLVPSVTRVSDTHAPSHPFFIKGAMIHQTKIPSSFILWSGSDAQLLGVGPYSMYNITRY